MLTNGAARANPVAAAVAWIAAAGMLVFMLLEQTLSDTICWMSYSAGLLFVVPLGLHTLLFISIAFQNIAQRTYLSYGHAPLSFLIAVLAVVYLPFRATTAALVPGHCTPDTRYDPRLPRVQTLLYVGGALQILGLVVDSTRAGMCLALPVAELLAVVVLGFAGWIYWRPPPSPPPELPTSALPDFELGPA